MKKLVICLLAVCLAFSLCACGKSTETKVVEYLINDIGEVTFDSLEDIEGAEMMYGNLSESDKEDVENYDILLEARKKFDALTEGPAKLDAEAAYAKLNLALASAVRVAEVLEGVRTMSNEELIEQYNSVALNMSEALDMIHEIEKKYGIEEYTTPLKHYYSSLRGLTNFVDSATPDTPDIAFTVEDHILDIYVWKETLELIFAE